MNRRNFLKLIVGSATLALPLTTVSAMSTSPKIVRKGNPNTFKTLRPGELKEALELITEALPGYKISFRELLTDKISTVMVLPEYQDIDGVMKPPKVFFVRREVKDNIINIYDIIVQDQ